MSRITDILKRHRAPELAYSDPEGNAHVTETLTTDEAEQALLALFDEAIGEDEPEYNPAPWSAGTHELELKYQVRRELRAEIRERLGLL